MPGYDGTGPAGAGPFTGGGRGYCATNLDNIYDNRPAFPQTAGTGQRYLAGSAGFAGRSSLMYRGAGFSRWVAGGPGRHCGFGRGRGRRPAFRGRGAAFFR